MECIWQSIGANAQSLAAWVGYTVQVDLYVGNAAEIEGTEVSLWWFPSVVFMTLAFTAAVTSTFGLDAD
jgi:hypothetical protein